MKKDPEIREASMTNEKRDRNVRRVFLIFCIAFILFVAYAGYGLYWESTNPLFLTLYPINESETADGIIAHLTEEDFEKWPSLGKAIREKDHSVTALDLYENRSAHREFYQEYIYNETAEKPIYVEYEGEYFYIRTIYQ
ncbi:hypothetical protein E2N92_01335 [Methanofollis formosanus]|uniref:Uncharacterized protein n=1 Tax=Methanofollis formosanus TaxID=299308 RepID=A0A8G1A0E2_9EURY|nr:hypothetical protein [Methanofollis formosanus]QYZ78168.1 hypothetical protein E2N92_01335 [Methanofollis formosanus]